MRRELCKSMVEKRPFPTVSAGSLLTCQVLSPWKKKKSAKPHTTEVQTMQSRGMSLIRSPLRSWGWGESSLRARPQPSPFPGLPFTPLLSIQDGCFRKPS